MNPDSYTPELQEARELAAALCENSVNLDGIPDLALTLRWLAAEVRLMRLERALER